MIRIQVLHDIIKNANQIAPNKIALLHNGAGLTYNEIYQQSSKFANYLLSAGVIKGDRVCFYLEKRFEKVISIFAISMAGGAFVPIRRLCRAHQVIHIINDCDAGILITTASRIPAILQNIEQTPTLNTIISIGEYDSCSIPEGIRLIYWNDIMESGALTPYRDIRGSEHDLAAILYTSGSTGKPKGVVLNHLNIVAGAIKVSEYLKMTENDRLLSILTFGFDYGLNQLTTSFLNCAQLILFDYLFPRDILRAVEKYEVTGLAAVATTWIQLLQTSWENTSMDSLRFITNSGGSIPVKFVKELRTRIPDTDIYLMYGLTEAFRSTYLDPSMVDQFPNSIGKAISGEEILVLDKYDRPVEPGQVGELVHRGVLVAQGYWGEKELTAERFRKNPLQLPEVPIDETVVYSGDFIKIDADGYLYFEGRKDEMIKSAGNRISPTEIEEILYNSGFISEAVALGIPHEIYGQVVLVVLSLQSHEKKSENDILLYCRSTMPPFMVPHEILIWDKLPRNTNGKLDRASIKGQI